MKKSYERPLVQIEFFAPNVCTTACDDDRIVEMNCLAGSVTGDSISVVSTNCTVKGEFHEGALYATYGNNKYPSSGNRTWGTGLFTVCVMDTNTGANDPFGTPIKYATGNWTMNTTSKIVSHSSTNNQTHNNVQDIVSNVNGKRWHCQVATYGPNVSIS